ncbi:T9SS type A sorting domain-containing protein, partial [bacterium]
TMDGNKSVTAYFTETEETISTPTTPTGPSSGTAGETLTFSTGGAVSNLGHDVEYRFDWGDGNISAWGSSTQSYFWNSEGYNLVAAQARCATHTSVESEWSSTKIVTINPTGVEIVEDDHIPDSFHLSQNFPNPFNPETSIIFQVPHACDIHLDIFNIHGEHIATLASGSTPPGTFEVQWDAKNDFGHPVPSGFYIYRLQSEHFTSTKKMLLLK